jgi:hypothetical protein
MSTKTLALLRHCNRTSDGIGHLSNPLNTPWYHHRGATRLECRCLAERKVTIVFQYCRISHTNATPFILSHCFYWWTLLYCTCCSTNTLYAYYITFLSLYQSIPYEAYKRILFAHKDAYLFLQLLHSFLPHSSNYTYTYNGLGIMSFHKDGALR